MFFIGGIMDGQKRFDRFRQLVTCPHCGQYAALEAFMTFTYFMFFFLPIFKWNKHYYVRSTCCGTVWEIPAEAGQAIARGESVTLQPSDLHTVRTGHVTHRCPACGFETEQDFAYCPKCGKPL